MRSVSAGEAQCYMYVIFFLGIKALIADIQYDSLGQNDFHLNCRNSLFALRNM